MEVSRKRLEFRHELLPPAATLTVIANPISPTVNSQLKNLRSAAEILGIRLQVLRASSEQEFESIFSTAQVSAGGLVFTSPLTLRFAVGYRARPAIWRARNRPVP